MPNLHVTGQPNSKPVPTTVTGLPPAKMPVSGTTWLMTNAVRATQNGMPLVEKSCMLVVISTGTLWPGRWRGVMHSSLRIGGLYVATTIEALVPNLQK